LIRSPAFWGIAYLSLIPIFATVYSAQGVGGFHDSNIRNEAATADDAAELRDSLTTAAVSRIKHLTWTIPGSHLVLYRPSVSITGIGFRSEGRLLLEASGTYGSAQGEPPLFGNFSEFVTVSPDGSHLTVGSGDSRRVGLPVVLTDKAGHLEQESSAGLPNPPAELIFPSLSGSTASPNNGFLLLPISTYNDLLRFDIAGTGDPSYVSGSWWRMIYLSAVTVTTLGFGDITPVSETARLYVALEAVLGVVFVGVFLSRLAIRVRE
jgi:Ion channel